MFLSVSFLREQANRYTFAKTFTQMLTLKLILVAAAILGIALLGMAVRIIFHKSHKFPETSAGHNKELRKRGVTCPRHEEIKCWGKSGKNTDCATCYEHAREVVN